MPHVWLHKHCAVYVLTDSSSLCKRVMKFIFMGKGIALRQVVTVAQYISFRRQFDGLARGCSKSSALAMELPQSWAKSSYLRLTH